MRKSKWKKIPKKELDEANIKYIKFLVGQNLSEKVKKAKQAMQENNVANNEENKPPMSDYARSNSLGRVRASRIAGLSDTRAGPSVT